MLELFPYDPRKNQEEIIRDTYSSAENGDNIILQSKTGSGKTVCTLSALIGYCLTHGKRLVYTTRTNSQQKQVITEARAIWKKVPENLRSENEIFAVPLQGRKNMCLLANHIKDFRDAFPEEMSMMCGLRKKRTSEAVESMDKLLDPDISDDLFEVMLEKRQCPYYYSLMAKDTVGIRNWVSKAIPGSREIVSRCRESTICPYEFMKSLMADSLLVVMPYIFIFNDPIRQHLLDWLNEETENILLVIDEAHNLPNYLRDMYSFTLSVVTIGAAKKEAKKFGIKQFSEGIPVSLFLDVLKDSMEDLAQEYIERRDMFDHSEEQTEPNTGPMEPPSPQAVPGEDDAVIPQDALSTALMSALKTTSARLARGIERIAQDGIAILDKKKNDGKLPRSYLLIVASFLRQWNELTEEYYIKLIYDRNNPQLEAYCLDPKKGGVICQTFHSSVHMSGTLEPLDEYRDCMDLPNSLLKKYPSPFDPANLLILNHPGATTRYAQFNGNQEMVDAYRRIISGILGSNERNTMVFFPSYKIMSLLTEGIHLEDSHFRRDIFFERSGASQRELLDQVHSFRDSPGAVYFSVIGGRVSEGMDFPGESLEVALLVGIPFPKPTARQRGLIRYYDIKTGNGWLFAVHAPTVRKMLQAMGRLIRSKEDRGVAVLLDIRARRFEQYFEGMELCNDLRGRIELFFDGSEPKFE